MLGSLERESAGRIEGGLSGRSILRTTPKGQRSCSFSCALSRSSYEMAVGRDEKGLKRWTGVALSQRTSNTASTSREEGSDFDTTYTPQSRHDLFCPTCVAVPFACWVKGLSLARVSQAVFCRSGECKRLDPWLQTTKTLFERETDEALLELSLRTEVEPVAWQLNAPMLQGALVQKKMTNGGTCIWICKAAL